MLKYKLGLKKDLVNMIQKRDKGRKRKEYQPTDNLRKIRKIVKPIISDGLFEQNI